ISPKLFRPNATEQIIDCCQTQVTVSTTRPQLVALWSSMPLSSIIIPSSVTAPTINYTEITATNVTTSTIKIANPLTITKTKPDSSIDVQVALPSDINISGPSSGTSVINLLEVVPYPTLTPPPAQLITT